MTSWAGQVWLRAHAQAPWRLDVVTTADADGRWVFCRDPEVTADLADIAWFGDDGIRLPGTRGRPGAQGAPAAAQGRRRPVRDAAAPRRDSAWVAGRDGAAPAPGPRMAPDPRQRPLSGLTCADAKRRECSLCCPERSRGVDRLSPRQGHRCGSAHEEDVDTTGSGRAPSRRSAGGEDRARGGPLSRHGGRPRAAVLAVQPRAGALGRRRAAAAVSRPLGRHLSPAPGVTISGDGLCHGVVSPRHGTSIGVFVQVRPCGWGTSRAHMDR
jgi:hypothetical protein